MQRYGLRHNRQRYFRKNPSYPNKKIPKSLPMIFSIENARIFVQILLSSF
jgi:hypothetical protein